MTIIYTETHLTQDPIYNFNDNSATFSIALSDINVVCHIHRQDNIKYMRHNELRSGDLVRIQGVFVTSHSTSIEATHTFIKIHSISLTTTIVPNNNCNTLIKSKKRKLSQVLNIDSNMMDSTGKYKEVGLDFNDYFFLLSGQAYSILDNSKPTINNENLKTTVQAKSQLLVNILAQLHYIYLDFTSNGITQLHVVNFVNTANSFMNTLNQIKACLGDNSLPKNITLCKKTPLPSFIYHAYIYE